MDQHLFKVPKVPRKRPAKIEPRDETKKAPKTQEATNGSSYADKENKPKKPESTSGRKHAGKGSEPVPPKRSRPLSDVFLNCNYPNIK